MVTASHTAGSRNWAHLAITTHNGNNHAVRDDRYRYIRYSDGSEELYDLQQDVAEWKNLAGDPALKQVETRQARAVPKKSSRTTHQWGTKIALTVDSRQPAVNCC